MRRLLSLLLLLFVTPVAAQDEGIVAGLSQNRVAIDATFVGSEILVFGAVKREKPAPEGELGVIVVIEGPSTPVTVRRKERIAGIWVNSDAVIVNDAPAFYAIATSGPFDEVLNEAANKARLVSIEESVWVMERDDRDDEQAFADAVIRIREKEGLYSLAEDSVSVDEATLFSTAVSLPSNIVEGLYTARIYLTREGDVVSDHVSYVSVSKVGLERWIYNLAHDLPLVYGFLSLAIAIAAGYLASTAFRFFWRT